MLNLQPIPYLSEEEYLAMEMASQERHEYVDGAIFAMTGASRAHNLISGNLYSFLHAQVKNTPCHVYMSNIKLKIAERRTYYYPDIILGCSENEIDDYSISAPCLIVEILSPSTAQTDKREKLVAYQNIARVQEYCLVAQDKYRVQKYTRQANTQDWVLRQYAKGDSIRFMCVDCEISLADLYAGVLS